MGQAARAGRIDAVMKLINHEMKKTGAWTSKNFASVLVKLEDELWSSGAMTEIVNLSNRLEIIALVRWFEGDYPMPPNKAGLSSLTSSLAHGIAYKSVQDVILTLKLPHVHVAYYLFRCGGTVSKLQWWCRTTPRAHLSALLQDFHDPQKQIVETFMGSPLNNHQWTQAKLPTKLGGAGLVSTRTEIGLDVVSLADVGFLASHRRCGPSIHHLFSPQPAPNLHDC